MCWIMTKSLSLFSLFSQVQGNRCVLHTLMPVGPSYHNLFIHSFGSNDYIVVSAVGWQNVPHSKGTLKCLL